MSASSDFRVALLGYGLGGSAFHAPLIATTPGLTLATIVTSHPDRTAQAAREHPGARILPRADDLWRIASEHDLAVITTPNRTHAQLALAALDHGLAVVVDKPFARTAAEAQSVIDAAHARNLILSAYHNRRWDSELLTIKRLMQEGAFGRVHRFESRLERWRPRAKGGWREIGGGEEGGGLLYDLGSHLIDQAVHLFGRVTHVYAELDSRREHVATDDDVFLALTHTNGVRSHLSASYLAAVRAPRVRVLGERGAYVKQEADVQEAALRSGERPDHPRWGEEPREHWGSLSDGATTRAVPSEPGAYQRYYAKLVAALRGECPPPVDAADAAAGLQIIEAAQRAARDRCVVALD